MTDVNHQVAQAGDGQYVLPRELSDEFGRHLHLLAGQLGFALQEADRECVSVGASFDELSAANDAIAQVNCPEPAGGLLRHACREIGASLHNAVVALQYHDRLSQRLELVRVALERLQTLLQQSPPRSADLWLAALREAERQNRLEQQRLGVTVETLAAAAHSCDAAAHSCDAAAAAASPVAAHSSVELF